MASLSVSMALPLSSPTNNRSKSNPPSSEAFLKRSVVKNSSELKPQKLNVEASLKENAVKGLTAAAVTSCMVIPEVAHAAGNDFSPSLQNFLLSIAAGGVVLVAIFGAVIGVANFDPVKRT
ncbi:unnamed protein product [Sphenostylis stenocarpa]|uniref:Ultraviolet-B-repressible protein n=1 Tax=Sphenostylis stenocarpa TaxID=92480 RepID=A0AA86TFG8_9FABA|nr:unnamed protein product [Sphenostylis stenocarpa]